MSEQEDSAARAEGEPTALQVDASQDAREAEAPGDIASMRTVLGLFALTFISTLYVGCMWVGVEPFEHGVWSIWRGYPFAVPLMTILLSHELGHYFVARIHHVDVSPPYFIPMPITLFGTFGAVIRMRGPVESRDALLDIGAAGPLAGLIVAIPILIYGISISPVELLDPSAHPYLEGHSLLYSGLIYALKGPIADGSDIVLSPTAFAGWAGLLVTMMNLVPVGQLDGGHVAYALFGPRQDEYSRRITHGLLALAIGISGVAMLQAWLQGGSVSAAASAGMHWGFWWFILSLMTRLNGPHPPTAPSDLSSARRALAWSTLLLFALLFMPTWIRQL